MDAFRRRLHSSQPNRDAGQGDEGSEGRGSRFTSSGGPAQPSEPIEEPFDNRTFFAEPARFCLICGTAPGSPVMKRRRRSASANICPMSVTLSIRRCDCGTILTWAGGDTEAGRQTKCVARRMDFRAPSWFAGKRLPGNSQATPGATDCVSFSRPFCPLASARALRIVAPIRTNPTPGSWLGALIRLSRTPAIARRQNRERVMRQIPGSGGKFRLGAAPKAGRKMASMNSRSCARSVHDPTSCQEEADQSAPMEHLSGAVCSTSPPVPILNHISVRVGSPSLQISLEPAPKCLRCGASGNA